MQEDNLSQMFVMKTTKYDAMYMYYFQGSVCDGWGHICIIVVFSFVYNITKFMEFETVIETDDSGYDASFNMFSCQVVKIYEQTLHVNFILNIL